MSILVRPTALAGAFLLSASLSAQGYINPSPPPSPSPSTKVKVTTDKSKIAHIVVGEGDIRSESTLEFMRLRNHLGQVGSYVRVTFKDMEEGTDADGHPQTVYTDDVEDVLCGSVDVWNYNNRQPLVYLDKKLGQNSDVAKSYIFNRIANIEIITELGNRICAIAAKIERGENHSFTHAP